MGKAYLILENGQIFAGEGFGAEGSAAGELVFTTGVIGYIETLSDPAYCGQIVMQTFPMIGNYGMIASDLESSCRPAGYVVREWCPSPSNFRSQGDVDAFLREEGIPGICGVDTRALTRILRENGTMRAVICPEIPAELSAVWEKPARITTADVSCTEKKTYPADDAEKHRVTLIDYGVKASLIRALTARGCTVTVVPHTASAAEILAAKPEGIVLSEGPGDPSEAAEETAVVRELAGKVPIFGLGLGHQIFARANGAETVRLKYGHRGANQPVRDPAGSRTYITSQNHGYAVVSDSVKCGTVRYANANDNSCEGIDYTALRAFTVQFTPTYCPGPQNTDFIYDRFITMMGGED